MIMSCKLKQVTHRFNKAVIPEYFKYMPDDALLNSKEAAEVFGYKNANALHGAVHDGCFPKPDVQEYGFSTFQNRLRNKWKKSTILAEIERRN